MLGAALHEADRLALLQHPVDHPHQDDDAEIRVVPAVDQAGGERFGRVAGGRRDARDDRLEDVGHADARLGGGEHGVAGVEPDHLLDLGAHALGLGGGQVDLVDDGDDLVIVLDRLVDIGQRLRLDPLRRVDHQQRALAGGEGAADLVGEVDMAGRVHQVELVGLAVVRGVGKAHGLGLDGDAPLALYVHVIKQLLAHLALGQPAGRLDQPVGQRRLAMVDMRDDGEVADVGTGGHRPKR